MGKIRTGASLLSRSLEEAWRRYLCLTMKDLVTLEESEASSVWASVVRVIRGPQALIYRLAKDFHTEGAPLTTIDILCSGLDLSIHSCTTISGHFQLLMCRSWTSIRLPRFNQQKPDKQVTYVVIFDLTDKTNTPVSLKPRAAVT
ncbi:hypothetical protein J6590_049534 [Homalodisca vitripennis]|nr:hypothetical protein J6590_049534 [Homalodisca vitripennis]